MCRMFLWVYKNVVAYLLVLLFFVVLLPLIVITLPLIVIILPLIIIILPLIRSILSKMDVQVNNDRMTYSLALTTDIIHLSRRQCFVRLHTIELFVATEADASLGHSSGPWRIIAGQVGMRCVYCFNWDKKTHTWRTFQKKYTTCTWHASRRCNRITSDCAPTFHQRWEPRMKTCANLFTEDKPRWASTGSSRQNRSGWLTRPMASSSETMTNCVISFTHNVNDQSLQTI